jgi:putative membrane protein
MMGRTAAPARPEAIDGGPFAVLDFLVRVLINGAALIITAKVLPDQIRLPIGPPGVDWLKIAAVALVFALVNSYIKPIVKALSFPISMLTLGLVAFVINAALLLLVAGIDGATIKAGLVVGHFPPKLDADTIVAAIIGAIVLSIVSTLLGFVNFGRKLAGLR